MIHVLAIADPAQIALRVLVYITAAGAMVAAAVAAIRLIALLIAFAQDERHGKLSRAVTAVGFPLAIAALLGAISGGAFFVESQHFGASLVGLAMVLR